jgi:uncharacterized protein (DUF2267 family)
MSGKQMEGDNERRRALARQAREAGRRPSEAKTTTGSSKQPEHVPHRHRSGPPDAGSHKPGPRRPDETSKPRAGPAWPKSNVASLVGASAESDRLRYRDLVAAVAARLGLTFDEASAAAEATVVVLARRLGAEHGQRLLAAMPAELHDDIAPADEEPSDANGFVVSVGRLTSRPPEQARYMVQAVLSTLAEHNHELIDAVAMPIYLYELMAPPAPGGGIVGPDGHAAPLTDDELGKALARLPFWSGNHRALVRTIALPPESMDLMLRRLVDLKKDLGRGPHIGRLDAGSATLVVRTASVDAVTALDIDLARRVDLTIDEAGAGMA